MQALFIGQTYIDVTFLTDRLPVGDEKHVASAYAVSFDGGGLRSNTHDLLAFIDVAIVAARLCEQMGLTPAEMLDYLKGRGCRVGGVTMGERGLLWYDETGTVRSTEALAVPADKIV